MSIALGQHTVAFSSGATAITTGNLTTGAAGSTFWAGLEGGTSFSSLADSKSNTYALIGTEATVFGSVKVRRMKAVNGAGGASHNWTYTMSASNFCSIWVIEITSADTTESLDQQNSNLDTASPWDSPSVTTTVANELLIAFGVDDSSGAGTWSVTAGNSFTLLDSQANTTGGTGATAYRIVAATGAYTGRLTAGTQPPVGTNMQISIDTFKDAGGGAQDTPELRGRPEGLRGQNQMQQLLAV